MREVPIYAYYFYLSILLAIFHKDRTFNHKRIVEIPMHILAFSDIHGAYTKAEEILNRESAYDLILISGDLTTCGSPAEALNAIEQFQTHGKSVLTITGNMDSPQIEDVFIKRGCSINAKGVMIGDIGFFGVSAAPLSPLHTPYEISEDEILRRAELGWNNIKSARWKVFVPHAPPYKTKLDRILTGMHVGSTAIRTFIEQYQPDVVVCGHIHEARGIDTLGASQIINCGTTAKGYYAMVTISENIIVENRG
jgi:putative phosphoesterase